MSLEISQPPMYLWTTLEQPPYKTRVPTVHARFTFEGIPKTGQRIVEVLLEVKSGRDVAVAGEGCRRTVFPAELAPACRTAQRSGEGDGRVVLQVDCEGAEVVVAVKSWVGFEWVLW